jgi:hypothetical protein
MFGLPMNRLVVTLTVLASTVVLGAPARADKKSQPEPPLALPKVGDTLAPNGMPDWPQKLDWLYDQPSFKDATGKVVLHWFCLAKLAECTEDLARVVTLKENNPRVYIIAYVDGSKGEAKKLDPIRETEGVGRGTVAFGKQSTSLIRRLGITGPVSIVVGLDNKVALVTTGAAPADLDARDAKVAALASAIKDYTTSSDGPKVVKAGDKFQLSMTIKLASWLKYSKRTPAVFQMTVVPPDIKCDATTLRGAQLKIVNQMLMTAEVTCSGPRGVYQMAGSISFGYDNPVGGGSGLGADGAIWKFEIKP